MIYNKNMEYRRLTKGTSEEKFSVLGLGMGGIQHTPIDEIEAIVRKDLFTGLYSEEYLYGEGRKIIDNYTTSTICMFKIINLEEINQKYSRELGNRVVTEVSKYINENISENYVFVRYMGPKFAIAFSGVEGDSVASFLNDIKENIEELEISLYDYEEYDEDEEKEIEKMNQIAIPKLNFVISSYYKGTALEEVLKKLEEYLDNANPNESDINSI